MRISLSTFGALTGATLLLASGAASAASWSCSYTDQCHETEPCAEVEYDMTLEIPEGDGQVVAATTPDGEVLFFAGLSEDGSYSMQGYSGLGDRDVHLLVIAPDGNARYAVARPDGPEINTYIGLCAAAE